MAEHKAPKTEPDPLRSDAASTDAPKPNDAALVDALAATKDRLVRSLAEQENIRQKARRDRDEAVRYAAAAFAGDLLATADNLQRAIASVPEENRTSEGIAGLLAGVEATQRALVDAFTKHGLQRFDPIGQPFDPHRHEASFEVTDERYPSGTVVRVIQPGYLHHNRLLRPAMVGISKASEAAPKDPPVDGSEASKPDASEAGHTPSG